MAETESNTKPKLYTLTLDNGSKIESEVPTGPHNLRAEADSAAEVEEEEQTVESKILVPVMTVTREESAYTNSKSELKLQKVSVTENISYENDPVFVAINPQYYEVQGSVPAGPHMFRDEIINGKHDYMGTDDDAPNEKDQQESGANEKTAQKKSSKIPVKFRRSAEKVINDHRQNKERNEYKERNLTKKEQHSISLIPTPTNLVETKSDATLDEAITNNKILTPEDPEKQFDKIYEECKDDNVYSLNDSIVQQAKEIDPNEIDNIFKEIVRDDGKKDQVQNKEKQEIKQSKIPVYRTKSGDQVKATKPNAYDRRSSLRRGSDVVLQREENKKQLVKSSIPQKSHFTGMRYTDEVPKEIAKEKMNVLPEQKVIPVKDIVEDVTQKQQHTENEKPAQTPDEILTHNEENKYLSEAPMNDFREKTAEDEFIASELVYTTEKIEIEEKVEEIVILEPEQDRSIYYTILNDEIDNTLNTQNQNEKSQTEMGQTEYLNTETENYENIENKDLRRLNGIEVCKNVEIISPQVDQEKVDDCFSNKEIISQNYINLANTENNLKPVEEVENTHEHAIENVQSKAYIELKLENKNVSEGIAAIEKKDDNRVNDNEIKLRKSLEYSEDYDNQKAIIESTDLMNVKPDEIISNNLTSNDVEINEMSLNTNECTDVKGEEKIEELMPQIEKTDNETKDTELYITQHIASSIPPDPTYIDHEKKKETFVIVEDSKTFESNENVSISPVKPNDIVTLIGTQDREIGVASPNNEADEEEPDEIREKSYEPQTEFEEVINTPEYVLNGNGDLKQRTHIEAKMEDLDDSDQKIDDFPENYILKGRVSAITNAINANEIEQKTLPKIDSVIPKRKNILQKIAIFEQPQIDEHRSLKSFKSFTMDKDRENPTIYTAKTAEPKLSSFEFKEAKPIPDEVQVFKPKIIDEIVKKEIKEEKTTTIVHEVDIKITEEVLEPKGSIENRTDIDRKYLHTEPKTNLNRIKSVSEKTLNDNIKGKVNTLIERMISMEYIDHKPKEIISIKEMPRKKTVSDRIAMFENMTATPQRELRRNVDPVRTKKQIKYSDTMDPEQLNSRIEELKRARTTYGRVEEVPAIILNNGQSMPVLALGTAMCTASSPIDFQIHPELVRHVVEAALDLGYRAFDTAHVYGNERAVGAAIRAKIDSGAVKREDLFIINKLWSTHHRSDLVEKACRDSLRNMELDYFDLYLIHNPMSFKEGGATFPKIANVLLYSEHDYLEAWLAMEQLLVSGLTRSIGVSNFNSEQITRILDKGRVKPVVNQVECHPYLTQYRLSSFCETRGIKLSCYATLGSRGTPAEFKNPGTLVLDDPLVVRTAERARMTPSQLLIRYQLQRKHGVVVKTSAAARLWENLAAVNLRLTDVEMDLLSRLNKNRRYHSFIG
ncbi:1,5-anhydro-D-fructose reductase [Eumeta japonica]|uniref:1,5-anhydro-D-fructose reductase n=1 Tax=Eumeta variegata TaxID=151549 RepID=A0A4C1XJS7_EUMVA|nr:1,5-anhydro-D-fructose reductase [Eumeta japonica]